MKYIAPPSSNGYRPCSNHLPGTRTGTGRVTGTGRGTGTGSGNGTGTGSGTGTGARTGASTLFCLLISGSAWRLAPRPLLRLRQLSAAKQGFGETYPHNPKVVADMTALHHIHEAGILHNLGRRAKEQKPYTFMVGAARCRVLAGPSRSGGRTCLCWITRTA